jgi:ribulose-5-phosphate 4-epimerase/fuculose-1-phosphate aldolase
MRIKMSIAQINVGKLRREKNIRDAVSEDEWRTRVDLAACYRLILRFGMSDQIYNHISARVPSGDDAHFLINAWGLHYSEVTASNLYKIDIDGNVVLRPDTEFGVNTAAFLIHSAVHKAREDLKCVIHTHTRAGMAVAAMKCGILPYNQVAMRFYGRTGFHEFEEPFSDLSERERIARNIADHDVLILLNHGLLAGGRSIAECFNTMYWLEQACQVQVDLMASGAETVAPSQEMATKMANRYRNHPERIMGLMEWNAYLRLLDREDSSYRN